MTITEPTTPQRPSLTVVVADSPPIPSPPLASPSILKKTSSVSPRSSIVKRFAAEGKSLIYSSPSMKGRKKVSFSASNEIFEHETPVKAADEASGNKEQGTPTDPGSPSIKYTNSPKGSSKKKKDSLRIDMQTTKESCCDIPDTFKAILSYFML